MAVSFGKGRVRCQRVRSWRPLNREAYCSFLYIHQLGRENRKDEVSESFRPCFVFSDDRRIQPRNIGKKERERETAMTKFTISFCTRLQGVLLLVSKPNSSAPFSSKPTKTRRLTNQVGMTKSLRRSQRD